MLFESDKVMFEIYRETEYTGKYRVCYFTELQDHNKETEINHALAGEHFFDGFIKNFGKDEAKEIINSVLNRLNNGETMDAQEVEGALGDHMAWGLDCASPVTPASPSSNSSDVSPLSWTRLPVS